MMILINPLALKGRPFIYLTTRNDNRIRKEKKIFQKIKIRTNAAESV